MFLNKLFKNERGPQSAASAETAEHLMPADYFSQERIDGLRQSLGKLRTVDISSIERI